jgi:hypothetical protein
MYLLEHYDAAIILYPKGIISSWRNFLYYTWLAYTGFGLKTTKDKRVQDGMVHTVLETNRSPLLQAVHTGYETVTIYVCIPFPLRQIPHSSLLISTRFMQNMLDAADKSGQQCSPQQQRKSSTDPLQQIFCRHWASMSSNNAVDKYAQGSQFETRPSQKFHVGFVRSNTII